MLKILLTIIISLFSINLFSSDINSSKLRFVVLSDIHIYSSGKIPALAPKAIEHVKALSPDMVLITGDHTNGNRGDGVSLSKVRTWYKSLNKLLNPLLRQISL